MAKRTKRTKDEVKAALMASEGNISRAADALGVTRQSIHAWMKMKSWKDVHSLVYDLKETFLDEAEDILKQHIREGNVTTLLFFLKTQGHERGYQERQHVTNDGKIEIVPIGFVPSDAYEEI